VSIPILNLDDAPNDAIERLVYLNGVLEQVQKELGPMWQRAYFDARFTGRLDEADGLGYHSHKRIMQFTRAENEQRGRQVRWGDRRG
jgi:hypothetical protein